MATGNQDQDRWAPNEVEQVVLAKLNISNWLAARLMQESGFEFRYTDPDIHPRPGKPMHDGMIFGSRKQHEKLFDWFDRQLAIPVPAATIIPAATAAPAKPVARVRPVSSLEEFEASKGQLAYEARVAGDAWDVIGKAFSIAEPARSAKAYAKSRDLAWPIASTQAAD